MLANGSTAIDGLSGSGSEEPTTGVAIGGASPPIRYALMGWTIFFTCCSPRLMNPTGSFVPMWSRTIPETQIPPGSARASNRAAILTASPKRLSPCTMMSPTWMPMRNRICSPAGRSAFSLAMASCTATAHSTASTALAKSATRLSPAVLKIRGNQAIDYDPVGRKCAESGDLIKPHQAAVALDIGGEDRGELSFDGRRFQPRHLPTRSIYRSRVRSEGYRPSG